jgi:hypothetical protein
MEKAVKSYEEFLLESTKEVVYPTNFKGMVQSSLASVYTSVMAIAQELANEKAARNPHRYSGTIEDVDITRALNMIFHSDWKKKLKQKALGQMMNKSMERAAKQDTVIAKKNQRALGRMMGDKDFNLDIDKSSVRFSDDRSGSGPGSNQ